MTTTLDPVDRPMSRPRRAGRPGRAIRFLIASIVITTATWVGTATIADRGRATEPVDTGGVPLPGDVARIGDLPVAGGPGGTPQDRMPLAERRDFWAARVLDRPDDFLSLTQLALVEAEGARLTADLGAYERAAALIDRALAVVPAYPPTIRARGAIRFALHDFRGALDDAERVLTAAPDDAAALGLAGDAALETGDLEAAEARYDRLAELAPGPWLDVRLAHLASLRGDHAGALALARSALATATATADTDPAETGFYAFAVGEYARLAGDPTLAGRAFDRALVARPTDLGALVGLARVDAAEGRTSQAIAGLRAAAAIAPQPETLALLGDLLSATGDVAGAEDQFATIRAIARLGAAAGTVYDRVLLRFELDHGGDATAALATAQAGLTARPDAAGHDVVAWALHRLGRDEDALQATEAARAFGADDARLRFHEGAIRLALGETAAGRQLIEAALDLGPALDPIERSEALALLD